MAYSLSIGDTQHMIFREDDPPPIFNQNAPKHDIIQTEKITRKLTKPELKKLLEEKGFNGEGKVDTLKIRAMDAVIPLAMTKTKVVPGYVGKPKGAAQIACERGFITLDGNLPNGSKFTMHGTSSKNAVIGVELILTPKCHPEIAGRGVEYAWEYSKLRFRCDFNDAIPRNLKKIVLCVPHIFVGW